MTTLIRLVPLVLAVVMMQTPATEPGFTQLFNGKDFTGARPIEQFRTEIDAALAAVAAQ